MTDQAFRQLARWAAAALLLPVGAAVLRWGPRAALGVAAGGAWNLTSLWCLVQLLSVWLGPQRSTRRVVGWLLVKFPALYLTAWLLLRHQAVSPVGFGVGFTVVLVTALGFFLLRVRQLITPAAHDR